MLSWSQIHFNATKICITLLLFTLPLSTKFNGFSIIILAFLFIIGGNYGSRLKALARNKVALLMVLLFLVYLGGIYYTENEKSGEKILIKSLSILLFPFILSPVHNEFRAKDLYWFFRAFLIGCLGICVFRVFTIASLLVLGNASQEKITVSNLDIHPTYLGLYLNFIIQALFYLYYKFRASLLAWQKGLVICTCLFFAIFIFLGNSRINILLLILTCTVFSLLILKNKLGKFTLVLVNLSFIGFLLGLSYLIPETRDKLFNQIIDLKLEYPNYYNGWNATNLRVAEWSCAIENIKSNLSIGVGTGDGQDALETCYKKIQFWNFSPPFFNCHNQYLQITLTNGLIGLITILAIFFFSLVMAVKQKNLLYLGFIASVMLVFFTESVLMVQKGIVFFSFFTVLFSYYGKNLKID